MNKTIYVLGVGHNTPVFINLALDCGYEIKGLYHYDDSRTGQIDHDYMIIGSFEDLFAMKDLRGMNFLLSMGNNEIRSELCNRLRALGGYIPSLIHPTAVISRFTRISETGVIISPFTYIQADTVVEENTIILSHVNISHTNVIGKNCFIAGGSMIGAYTTIADNVFIGQGVLTISDKVKNIGAHSYVGAGSLLTHDVEEYTMVVGRPAKVIKRLGKDKRWYAL